MRNCPAFLASAILRLRACCFSGLLPIAVVFSACVSIVPFANYGGSRQYFYDEALEVCWTTDSKWGAEEIVVTGAVFMVAHGTGPGHGPFSREFVATQSGAVVDTTRQLPGRTQEMLQHLYDISLISKDDDVTIYRFGIPFEAVHVSVLPNRRDHVPDSSFHSVSSFVLFRDNASIRLDWGAMLVNVLAAMAVCFAFSLFVASAIAFRRTYFQRRCAKCGHAIISSQSNCPECGNGNGNGGSGTG